MARVYHFQLIDPSALPGVRLGAVPPEWRCTGRSKRTGQPCQALRVKGFTVCRNHGAYGLPVTKAKLARMAKHLKGEKV